MTTTAIYTALILTMYSNNLTRTPVDIELPFPTIEHCKRALNEIAKSYPLAVCRTPAGYEIGARR